MRKFYMLTLCVLLAIGSHAETFTTKLDKTKRLKTVLPENYLTITDLKVVGPLNGEDMRVLCEMVGLNGDDEQVKEASLDHLDLKEATIDKDEHHPFGNKGQYTERGKYT